MAEIDINIDKISRVVLQVTKNLALKMHIKLIKENQGRKENFHKLFTATDGKSYLKLDLQSFLTLELQDKDKNWSKDQNIIIDQKNLVQINRAFKRLLDNIYKETIFAIDKKDNSIVLYSDMVEKFTEKIFNLNGGQRIIAKPAVVTDENEITYEGVLLYINKTENYVELPIDAFEALVTTLEKIDLFLYSQTLLNYYISTIQTNKIQLTEYGVGKQSSPKKPHPLFSSDNDNTEEVQSNMVKQEDNNIFNYDK